jgi:hypothetical protein
MRQRLSAGALLRAQGAPELQQREGVAAGRGDEILAHGCGRAAVLTQQQLAGRLGRDPADGQRLERGRRERPRCVRSRRDEQPDPLAGQAARDEHQRVGRLRVEPLGVVDDAEHGPVAGGLGKQAERGHRHRRPVAAVGLEGERSLERLSMRGRQPLGESGRRSQQLVQHAERKLGLGFEPGRAQHERIAGMLGDIREQRRLPRAEIAVQEQRRPR